MHVGWYEVRIFIRQPVKGAYIVSEIGIIKPAEVHSQEMIEADIGSHRGGPAVKDGNFPDHLSQRAVSIGKIINKPMQAHTPEKVIRPHAVLLRIQFSFNIVPAEISHDHLGVFS